MTYTAFGSRGPRIALALSGDLFHWKRLGLATFQPYDGLDFNGVNNKDALVFPAPVSDRMVNQPWPSFIVRSFRARFDVYYGMADSRIGVARLVCSGVAAGSAR